jgi:hypothetical protein
MSPITEKGTLTHVPGDDFRHEIQLPPAEGEGGLIGVRAGLNLLPPLGHKFLDRRIVMSPKKNVALTQPKVLRHSRLMVFLDYLFNRGRMILFDPGYQGGFPKKTVSPRVPVQDQVVEPQIIFGDPGNIWSWGDIGINPDAQVVVQEILVRQNLGVLGSANGFSRVRPDEGADLPDLGDYGLISKTDIIDTGAGNRVNNFVPPAPGEGRVDDYFFRGP